MRMSSRIEKFIADSTREMKEGPEYISPTCAEVEIHYRNIFEGGEEREQGIIYSSNGKVTAGLYVAELRDADEWVIGAEAVTKNATVLVKNPHRNAAVYGSLNALVLSRGYLLVAKPQNSGFAVMRPVRGENRVGYNFQTELKGMFEKYVTGLPQDFTPPVWGAVPVHRRPHS